MILFRGQNGSPPGAGFKACPWNDNISLYYAIGETEYVFEDENGVVLVDTVIDKSKGDVFLEQVRRLSLDYACRHTSADLFAGAYFYIIIDKKKKKVTVARDQSGIKTGYYCSKENSFGIGNLVHEVADRSRVSSFNDDAIFQLLYLDYLMDGHTFYDDINEIKIGQTITFDAALHPASSTEGEFEFSKRDNDLSLEENISRLRESIVLAHKKQASGDNVVMLSGGIDSAVIAGALSDPEIDGAVRAVSYRVQGTDQDETPYAKEIADHLKLSFKSIEVDPGDKDRFQDFENTVLGMNNPYLGVWIYGRFDDPTPSKTYFAGQDTRLHTPDLNLVDRVAFALFWMRRWRLLKIIFAVIHKMLSPLRRLQMERWHSRFLRGISRLLDCFDIKSYVDRYFFKLNRDSIVVQGISPDKFEAVKALFQIDFDAIGNSRQLYNEIVKLKWREQYTDDIRYLQDMARLNNTYLALPFYDIDLAIFSSSIPFRQATRYIMGRQRFSSGRVLVKKYMLRSAFKDRLTGGAFYRQKAVSNTFHLLFNGALGGKIKEVINGDLGSEASFIRDFRLERFIGRFLESKGWKMSDDKYLLKVYHVAALCVYYKEIIGDHRHPAGAAEKVVEGNKVDSCRPD